MLKTNLVWLSCWISLLPNGWNCVIKITDVIGLIFPYHSFTVKILFPGSQNFAKPPSVDQLIIPVKLGVPLKPEPPSDTYKNSEKKEEYLKPEPIKPHIQLPHYKSKIGGGKIKVQTRPNYISGSPLLFIAHLTRVTWLLFSCNRGYSGEGAITFYQSWRNLVRTSSLNLTIKEFSEYYWMKLSNLISCLKKTFDTNWDPFTLTDKRPPVEGSKKDKELYQIPPKSTSCCLWSVVKQWSIKLQISGKKTLKKYHFIMPRCEVTIL